MQVNVWNDNIYPFSQEFKGEKITIQPKQCIKMEFEDAMEFRSAFSPIVRDGDGQPLPSSYKMIRVESPGAVAVVKQNDDLICHATGKRASSKAELEAEIAANAHLQFTDEELEKELAAKQAEGAGEMPRRKPGRPPKSA